MEMLRSFGWRGCAATRFRLPSQELRQTSVPGVKATPPKPACQRVTNLRNTAWIGAAMRIAAFTSGERQKYAVLTHR